MTDYYPQRIVCLTEETTEWLYLLGEEDRIVGISGFTVRPPRARKEKPKVSAFTSAKIDRIVDLRPDLVLGFSDLQADIAAELIRHGIEVLVFNQRSIDEILNVLVRLGALVGAGERAQCWVRHWKQRVEEFRPSAGSEAERPVIYFEEWDDPLISGIQWVSELITLAGGEDAFPELGAQALGKNRIIAEPQEVVRRNPDIIVGSWCGKKFRPERVAGRPGWDQIKAVQHGEIHEIKSPLILQPGPAALTDGLEALQQIVSKWSRSQIPSNLAGSG